MKDYEKMGLTLIIRILLSISYLFIQINGFPQVPSENYPVDSASLVHTGVPHGEVLKFTLEGSKIFPGTTRDYWIYIPQQYRPERPACVYVNQDGIQFKAPAVFDNLIHNREMPITIGIFIMPGRVKGVKGNKGEDSLDRINRSFEYDGLGDAYVRFILEEILPDAEKQKTTDGRAIRLSKSGNDRAIGGASSGAICAFTAAWERPKEFSRVFSSIGSYVGFRGGDRYPTLVRKYEPKPIRIYLEDGSNDLNIFGGDWWMANQMMERALSFSGYEVSHSWGEGAHNGNHATSVFPQAMRWLWKDYPKPVEKGSSKNKILSDIIIPNEDWELVGQGYSFTEGTAVNSTGEVFYQDIPNSRTFKVGKDGKPTILNLDAKKASGTSFGPDDSRYVVTGATKQILRYDKEGKETVVADSIPGNDLVVARNGNIYLTSPNGIDKPSKVYLIRPNGEKMIVDEGLKFANGIALTRDETQLLVTESASHWVWIYKINPDGTLAFKQHYGWLQVPDGSEFAWPDGLRCDRHNMVYVASTIGIQILDQEGRLAAILPVPTGNPSNLCFGGPASDILYVTCKDKVYRRKLKVNGGSINNNLAK